MIPGGVVGVSELVFDGVSIPIDECRRCRLWKISRYAKMIMGDLSLRRVTLAIHPYHVITELSRIRIRHVDHPFARNESPLSGVKQTRGSPT